MKIPFNIGDAGAHQEKLWRILNDMAADLEATKNLVNDLKAKYNDLVAKYNAHVHTENVDATYTQNANTAAVAAGSQGTASAVADVVLKTVKSDNYTG